MTVERSAPSVQEGAGQNKIQPGAMSINGAVSECAHLDMQISVFPNVLARAIDRRRCTWEELAALVATPKEHPSKAACPLIKLATFGDKRTGKGALRHDANVLDVWGIEGDYDGGLVSVEQAAEMLRKQDIEALIYTSPSHTEARPRWRVLAPLSQAYPVTDRARMVAMLNAALGGILASESFVSSQTFYFGKVKGADYRTCWVQGQAIDTLDLVLPEQYPEERDRKPSPAAPLPADDLDRTITLAAVSDGVLNDLRSALDVFTERDADSYAFWAGKMGLALKSLAQAGRDDVALEFWHAFSAKSPRYDADQTNAKWDTFEPNTITYRSIFDWAQERGWVNPKSAAALKANATAATRLDRTDAGNMALLAKLTNGNLRYVPEVNTWLCWNGQRWDQDEYGVAAQRAALQVAEHYLKKAAQLREQAAKESLDDKERKNIEKAVASVEKWAAHCRNRNALMNMLNLAKSDVRFALPMDRLDRDPWLFGVANGVVDLRTGALREASRDDYVTKSAPVPFDAGAQAPQWCKFIKEVTGEPASAGGIRPRPALASYIQRALGYALTGSTEEQKMFIAVGEGSNGKNVMLDTLQWVMGSYCQTIAPEALMASRHDADAERPTPSARMLAGARVAISSESKEGQQLNVALVKRHTGGGYMTARALHENAFTFEITHKLWLMTNHQPRLDHMDEAVRGRLHMIPFSMRWNRPGHPERNPALPDGDKGLKEKIKAEGEGVLAWLVAGAVAYASHGLELPVEVSRMTRDYLSGQDPLGLWLDACRRCDPSRGDKASDLFDAFIQWCDAEGYSPEMAGAGNQTAFSKKLLARGVESVRSKEGKRYALNAQFLTE